MKTQEGSPTTLTRSKMNFRIGKETIKHMKVIRIMKNKHILFRIAQRSNKALSQ
jgi:hypothetical protein